MRAGATRLFCYQPASSPACPSFFSAYNVLTSFFGSFFWWAEKVKKGLAFWPNPLILQWRKCMGIEPTYQGFSPVHRI